MPWLAVSAAQAEVFNCTRRAGTHVPVNRGDAAGQARGFDFQPAIFLEVRADRGHDLRKRTRVCRRWRTNLLL